ncbi:cysteine--tRNA ligase [Desulfurococcus amylolyticus]|uniref:cysteine--tRNA ligase n=1 Tax=Desulfurococcus amylolyticus TaxID=94694 RepID=UPI000A94BF58|nr:cysteine--tRNA ligase [Desulfurococcus amylolyticus]
MSSTSIIEGLGGMLPAIKIYDTLSRDLKELQPIEPGIVKMYVCGPTVYDYTHIGHGKTYVIYDAFKRYLSLRGYHVVHVMNITDIDDKIIKRSQDEGRDWSEIVDEYTRDYLSALEKLNVTIDHHPRVSEHINEIIGFIQGLIDKGYAYIASSGSVYFNVDKYDDYGHLSGRVSKETWGQEQEFLSEKRNPYDFALWKAAKPGEPYWESPWGRGRPGWHIECSVMSSRYLGSRFDIHGGGTDLIFPHHENERAQSEAFFGSKPWVSIWMHSGLVMVGKDKMSKSLKNIIPLKEAFNKWGPMPLRLWYLSTHYRKPLYFSEEALENSVKLYERLTTAAQLLRRLAHESTGLHYAREEDLKVFNQLVSLHTRFHNALSDDFNTAEALAVVNEYLTILFRDIQYNPRHLLVSTSIKLLREFNTVLGVLDRELEGVEEGEALLDSMVEILINVRKELRKRGIYDLSDTIRSDLSKIGIQLMDKGLETTWVRVRK